MEEGTSRTMIDEDQVNIGHRHVYRFMFFVLFFMLVDSFQVEESIEYFATTKKVEKCDLTLQHLENLELVSDNGGWEMEKLTTLFKVWYWLKHCRY